MNKKLIAPIVTAAAMLATSVGSTFALFSSKASSRIDINAGKLEVKLEKTALHTYSVEANDSGDRIDENGHKYSSELTAVEGVFTNGGTASFTDSNLALKNISPGDRVAFDLKAAQGETNISYKYRVVFEYIGTDETIGRGMIITTNISGETKTYLNLKRYQSAWLYHDITTEALNMSLSFDMELPVDCGNEYQEKVGAYSVYIETVQGNAAVSGEEKIEYFADASYGFANSYQEIDGHWVHEISNAEEFRNILDSSVHSSKTGRLDYPGAGEKETVYLLRNDIDFGGLCWNTPELLADVKANAFVGVLDTVSGYPVTLSNIHVNAKTGSILEESDGIICLFDKVYNAKISNLVLDDMTIDDSTAKVGALLALGNKGVNQEYLELKNITTNLNCHVNIKASAGGIVGVLRNFNDHISFVNCVNNANVSGALTDSGTNIGGIMSQSSLVGDDLEILFENCTNNGDIVGGYCVGGLAGSLSEDGAIKNCVNNGDITYTVGKLAKAGKTWTYQVCGSFVGAYAFNSDTQETIYNIEMIDSLNRGNLFIGNETYPIVDFAYGPTFYEVSGAKVQNPTLEEFESLFVSKYTNVNIPMSFNGENKLVIEAPQGVTVAKYVLNLRFATTHVSRSAGKSNAETSPHDLASIEILAQDLATFDLKKINQVGYFAPDATCGIPEYVQSNPAVKTKKDALKYGFIDYSYHGNADLTPGYHENDKGGYIVWDTTGTEGDLYRAPYIWGEEQTCTYNITAYDAENKTVATGTLNGGVIISGIVTYGGTEWHA